MTAADTDARVREIADDEAEPTSPEIWAAGLTAKRAATLSEVVRRDGMFVRGSAAVVMARRLESFGLVTLTDHGRMRGVDGRDDRERWYVEPTDLGRAVARVRGS